MTNRNSMNTLSLQPAYHQSGHNQEHERSSELSVTSADASVVLDKLSDTNTYGPRVRFPVFTDLLVVVAAHSECETQVTA
jgi:hypothetical protein